MLRLIAAEVVHSHETEGLSVESSEHRQSQRRARGAWILEEAMLYSLGCIRYI